MKIRVHTKKPVTIAGKVYPKGVHQVSDSLAHKAELKALFKKDALTILPRTDAEIKIQQGKDALAASAAQSARNAAKK